ncbi:MAG: hypothetical protein L6R41_002976 [Letrouitia leprolyta]|nr:MAG: hypothetical protein L6R41_002976 [Letrouitia leprolyta]
MDPRMYDGIDNIDLSDPWAAMAGYLTEAHFSILAAEVRRNPRIQDFAEEMGPGYLEGSLAGSVEVLADLWNAMADDYEMGIQDFSDVIDLVLNGGGRGMGTHGGFGGDRHPGYPIYEDPGARGGYGGRRGGAPGERPQSHPGYGGGYEVAYGGPHGGGRRGGRGGERGGHHAGGMGGASGMAPGGRQPAGGDRRAGAFGGGRSRGGGGPRMSHGHGMGMGRNSGHRNPYADSSHAESSYAASDDSW